MAGDVIRRGSVVIVVIPGDFGKPRPAVVIQADIFSDLDSVLVCPLTSDLSIKSALRLEVALTEENGLRLTSQIMLEKLSAVRKGRIGAVIGQIDSAIMDLAAREIAVLIGLS
jgi:mRNA interferase MazF